MRALRVLLTNNALAYHAGSETYLRDVALSLLRRGHRPVAFSLIHGAVADELRRATIPVVDDLERLGDPPDVIHGHHHLETLIAALTFPGVPIVHFCHGWIPWEEKPLRHPAVRRYVAVDEVCADRLIQEEGIPAEAVETIFNFVDLARFRPRAMLPERPRRALVFSNQATTEGYVRQVAAACDTYGVELDVVGVRAGNAVHAPEHLLPQYDLVFAKARAALEAMAVGCAVVICDAMGAGPLVTPFNFDRLRARNFGVRELQEAHDVGWYEEQIAAFDRCAAAAVRDRIRGEADLEQAVDRLVALYERVMCSRSDDVDGSGATARHVRDAIARPLKDAWALGPQLAISQEDLRLARIERTLIAEERDRVILERDRLRHESDQLGAECRRLGAQCDRIAAEGDRLDSERVAVRARVAHLEASLDLAAARERSLEERLGRQLTEATARIQQLEAELSSAHTRYRGLTTLRVRDAILRLPVVGPGAQSAGRLLARVLKA